MWQHWMLVALGGAIGSTMRFALSRLWPMESPASWPWATLTVNLTGCLLIGVAMGVLGGLARPISESLATPSTITHAPTIASREAWRVFLVTGILGGFTTFSAFGFETLRMIQSGHLALAGLYAIASTTLGTLAAALGWWMAH